MDHLILLKKYIRLVIDCDGITFVANLRTPASRGYDPRNWTEAEVAALEQLDHEAELDALKQKPSQYLPTGRYDA